MKAATMLMATPATVRIARARTLPEGMTLLLEIAVGEAEPTERAERALGRSGRDLQAAASFFIEQILLASVDDPYRLLGARSGTDPATLRRHMALLLRLAHPDLAGQGGSGAIDRSVFAAQVNKAWEAVKRGDGVAAAARSGQRAAGKTQRTRIRRAVRNTGSKSSRQIPLSKPLVRRRTPSAAGRILTKLLALLGVRPA